jgi:glycosyltransferase involved in cell wall biosynthesis
MKISIVTASYNSVKTLADTMESVLGQIYTDWEYIVVDGGSTDGTVDLIRKYEPRFGDKLKWTSEPDKGIYDAMNKGIQKSTGDVIGILNSDDYYTTTDALSTIASALSDEKLDAVYGDIHFIKEGEPDKTVRYYSSRRFKPFWLRFGFMPAHPSFYVRRVVYQKAGLYDMSYKIGSDFEMMVRLFRKQRIRYQYLAKDFVTMRTGGMSTNGIKSRRTLLAEDVRACRSNGIYTNQLIVVLKYLYKVLEYRP